MTAGHAFGYYFGLKLHFSNEAYSVIKYGIETAQTISKFNKLTQNQKYKFEWLSNTYPNKLDMVYACLGCELDDVNIQFADRASINESYIKYKSRRESLSYNLKSELKRYYESDQQLDANGLMFGYFSKQYSPELTLLLDTNFQKLKYVINDKSYSFAGNSFLKLYKYRSFFNPTKYLHLLNNHEESVSSCQY